MWYLLIQDMPPVFQNTRRDGHSGLSTPVTVWVCIASSVAALTLGGFTVPPRPWSLIDGVSALVTLGVFAWIFIIRRNKDTTHTHTSTSTKPQPPSLSSQPRKQEEAQDQANQIPSPKPSPPPAYSPGLMKSPSTSNKKSTPPLNVDIGRNTEPTLPSPLRSASFNPSTKTQSIGSRISSRMSAGSGKLYVYRSSWHSMRSKLELTHLIITAPG